MCSPDQRKVLKTVGRAVRQIFERYNTLRNVRNLKQELDARGITRKHWRGSRTRFSRGGLYNMLRNPIYVGEIPHKDVTYPGLHEAIVDRTLWDSVQSKLTDQAGRARHDQGRKAQRSLLIGKLRDESGAALTPTHANKTGRRYRYYSSPALLNGGAKDNQGWRLPAQEIERAVATALKTLLEDHKAIADALHQREDDFAQSQTVFRAADQWVGQLATDTSGQAMSTLIERVDLKPDGFQISVQLPLGSSHLKLIRFVPTQMRRRGVELKMIIGGRPSKADPVLLKALARAHRWFGALKAGKLVPDIARDEGLQVGYVRRILQLAFLAPSIVEAIVNGTQPPDLTTQKLVWTRLDPDWRRQRQQLGFA